MSKGVFFNMFRNGDLFIVREFVREMISFFPEYTWHYAHGNHINSLIDLPCQYEPMPHFHEVCNSVQCKGHEVSSLLPKFKPLLPNESVRKFSSESNLYINTWTGVYHGYFFPAGNYANMHELVSIWNHIGDLVYRHTGRKHFYTKKITEYFPTVDESKFDSSKVYNFVSSNQYKQFEKHVLMANGNSLSGQSKLPSMNHALVMLAKQNPDVAFIATSKFDRTMNNIFFTDDIFQTDFDLPLISILSSYCDVIVGKNSGPYTYANTKKNVSDPTKTFVSFSNHARDNLLYQSGCNCTFIHEDTDDENRVIEIVRDIIKTH
jgi:hypothetical protein